MSLAFSQKQHKMGQKCPDEGIPWCDVIKKVAGITSIDFQKKNMREQITEKKMVKVHLFSQINTLYIIYSIFS